MASDEEIRALARLTIQNKALIDIVFGVTNDFACLIEPTLERCARTGCKHAATVTQVDTRVKMCDNCAAGCIVRAKHRFKESLQDDKTSLQDGITLLRLRAADEETWLDLPDAPRIRRLCQYVDYLKKDDEVSPPTDPAEMH